MRKLRDHHALSTAKRVRKALRKIWGRLGDIKGEAWLEAYDNCRLQGLRLIVQFDHPGIPQPAFNITQHPCGDDILIYAGPEHWYDGNGLLKGDAQVGNHTRAYDFGAWNAAGAAEWILRTIHACATDCKVTSATLPAAMNTIKIAIDGKPGRMNG